MNSTSNNHIKTLPVSVIDIAPQKKRESQDHSQKSSRQTYSPFPMEVADLCFEYYMRDASLVFDPFAGWGDRAEAAKKFDRKYIGYDCSPEAILKAKEKGFENTFANSLNAEIPEHDGLVTCPPYFNLEKYAGEGIDKLKTWEGFLLQYEEIWQRCWRKAKQNSTYAIMIGEWRKNHKFYDLEYETRRIFKNLGAELFDQVVVSRKTTSKIKIMLPQAKRLGYTVRVHESLLVFKKHV